MIVMPYRADKAFDAGLDHVVKSIKHVQEVKDDDFLIICSGPPGTGKTTLMFHAYTEYAGVSKVSVEQIALTRPDFALALKNAKEVKLYRFVGYDEANVSKRDALSKWNRAVIDLYYSIRGLNMLHWWNNPSLDMIDKPFIEERVKGIIVIVSKEKNRPRLYYYFRKDDILDLLEKEGDLKHRTLKKHAKKYAYYRGWFKDYTGPLLNAYILKKQLRMEEKVDQFYEAYALDSQATLHSIAKGSGISETTAKKWFFWGVEAALLKEHEHYVMNGMGKPRMTVKGREELLFILKNHAKLGGGWGSEVLEEPITNSNRAKGKPRRGVV